MSNFFTIDEIAEVCHEAMRAMQRVTCDPAPSPPWSDVEEWQREASIDSVVALLDGATQQELHAAWYVEKIRDGWVYGPAKDAGAKTHPCLVSYDALPLAQQCKDAVFHAIVNAMAGDPPQRGGAAGDGAGCGVATW